MSDMDVRHRSSHSSERIPLRRSQTETWKDMRVNAILMCALAQTIAVVQIFPYTPFLVQHILGKDATTTDISHYTSIVLSGAPMGSFLSSAVWGRIADKCGRKFALMIGLASTAVGTMAFGMTQNVSLAIIIQFLLGLMNGNWGILVTQLEEILVDERAKERGFANFSMMYAAGCVLGPFMGGYTADPASKYKSLDLQILRQYPYVFPCFLSTILTVISFVLVVLFIPSITPRILQPQIHDDYGTNTKNSEELHLHPKPSKYAELSVCQTIMVLLTTKDYILSVSLFCLASFMYSAYEAIMPLWARVPTDQDGIGWNTSQIGTVFMISGIALVINNVGIYPILIRMGRARLTRYCFLIDFICLFFLFPYWLDPIGKTEPPNYWVLPVVVVSVVLFVSTGSLFTSTTMLIQSGVPHGDILGFANGFSQSLVNCVRMLAPLVAGALYSFGLEQHDSFISKHPTRESRPSLLAYYHPRDIVFYFFGALMLVCFFMTYALPQDIDTKTVVLMPANLIGSVSSLVTYTPMAERHYIHEHGLVSSKSISRKVRYEEQYDARIYPTSARSFEGKNLMDTF